MASPTGYSRVPGVELSLDGWAALPDDEGGEFVDGRIEEEEVADAIHELAVLWLGSLLVQWLRGHGGFVLGSDAKLAVTSSRGRKPDLSVYLPGGHVPPRRGLLRTPPDIVVEVVSPSPRDERRDRVDKLDEYAAAGVRYYWLLDPTLGSLEIFERGADGRYARAQAATSGTVAQLPGCPGLTIDLDELWAQIGRLGPETA